MSSFFTRQNRIPFIAVSTAVLFLIALSRFVRLSGLIDMASDEIWSIWQTQGTPQQIVQWTPYDWPPLYYLLLGGWRVLVGMHPVALRMLSVLLFLLASAIMYRLMRRLGVPTMAAMLGMLAYGALGYAVFVSLYVRGYTLVALLAPLALWLTLRYFDRPTLRRAFPLGLTLAAMFYTTLSTVGAFLALGLFSLVVYRRQIWRWWLPAGIAGLLALPEIISKAALGVGRMAVISQQQLAPLPQALGDLFSFYVGNDVVVWVLLLVIATVLLALWRPLRASTVGVLAWLLMPVALYVLNPIVGLFLSRYMLWVMVGLALWLGLGLARLPRVGQVVGGGLLAVLMFLPLPLDRYEYFYPPLGQNLAWLANHWRAGDVMLIDPNWRDPTCNCDRAEEWHYYTRLFFPQGLQFVDAPEGYPRVWYVTWQSRQDRALEARVNAGRKASIFVGPPEALIRLYEGPPDAEGIPFVNGMRFHGLEVLDAPAIPLRHEGENVTVRLWWSADGPLDADYSISLRAQYGEALVAQVDGPISVEGQPLETSRWQPGELYVDERTLALPFPAGQGDYFLNLVVYQWWDGQPISAPGVDDYGQLRVGRVYVKSW